MTLGQLAQSYSVVSAEVTELMSIQEASTSIVITLSRKGMRPETKTILHTDSAVCSVKHRDEMLVPLIPSMFVCDWISI